MSSSIGSGKYDLREVADFIRDLVLDQMLIVFKEHAGIEPTKAKMMEVIESGEFPQLTEYYNDQVNAVCDNLKS